MKRVRYLGPTPRVVSVPALRVTDVAIGDELDDVPNEIAASLCASECWEIAGESSPPTKTSTRAAWAEYAAGLGLEIVEGRTKKQLIADVEEFEANTPPTPDADASTDAPEEG